MRQSTLPSLLTVFGLIAGLTAQSEPATSRPIDQTAFFGLDKIWDVHLTVTKQAWNELFPERRSFGINNLGRFDYVKARAEIAGHVLPEVGLRLKGNSTFMMSRGSMKRPFKLDFDRFDPAQKFLGMKKLNLNNNATDATQIREAIAYQVYRQAKIPASRTAFARVFLSIKDPANQDPANQDPADRNQARREYLGLYTMIEQVDRRLMKRWFGSKKGLLVKPERRVLGYHGKTWNEKYAKDYHPKADTETADTTPLLELVKMMREFKSTGFEAAVTKVMDVEQFLNYAAVTVIIANTDSPLNIPHNYYLAVPRSGKRVVWIPWDLNLTFGGFSMAGTRQSELSIMEPSRMVLLDRILDVPAFAKLYRARVRQLITSTCTAKQLSEHHRLAKATTSAAIEAEARRSEMVTRTADASGNRRGILGLFSNLNRSNRIFRGQSLEEFIEDRERSVLAQLDGKETGQRGGFSLFGRNRNTTRSTANARLKGLLRESVKPKPPGLARPETLEAAASLFRQLDTDQSADLNLAELEASLLGLFKVERNRPGTARWARRQIKRDAAQILRELDGDRSRKLSHAEWRGGVERRFASWDANRDGKLAASELKHVVPPTGR